ncbi:DUF6498-containing protein [Candidatus Viadribacter manganicus]|uniref:Uncharacterized protein n=1 Tax=Candidatus Viadribacter manganicus TaxID=1759059 RepID=A0A1B1AEN6_9PROT|nr:DUF6498-containing protein [Candidatus Viadribacter manganicus]ANP45005.1 hypothetical protein ATE48_03255 [Candidatus Viadribacter manganicus]
MSEPKVPFDRSRTWPLVAAVCLNLIPVVGVLFWSWSAFALIVLYWLENLVVGVRTLLSMIANAAVTGGVSWIGALFLGGFFTFHYGLFCFGHGVFVMAMFGGNLNGDTILDLGAGVRAQFAAQTNLLIGFASIVAWQVVQFILYLVRGELRRTTVLDLMGAPYPRIIVLHVTIIFGGFVLLLLNQPLGGILVLALIKMAYDVGDVLRDPKPKEPVVESAASA